MSFFISSPSLPLSSWTRGCQRSFCNGCVQLDFEFPSKGIHEDDPVCRQCVAKFGSERMRGGSISSSSLDHATIEKMFDDLLEERQLKQAVREKMKAMTTGQKWQLLQASKAEAKEQANRENNDPGYWVDALKAGKVRHHS